MACIDQTSQRESRCQKLKCWSGKIWLLVNVLYIWHLRIVHLHLQQCEKDAVSLLYRTKTTICSWYVDPQFQHIRMIKEHTIMYLFYNYQLHIIILMLLICTVMSLFTIKFDEIQYENCITACQTFNSKPDFEEKVGKGDTFWAYPETVHANYLLIRGWESEMHSLFSLAEIESWWGVQKSSMLLHQHILMTTRKNVCYRTTLILLQ